MHRDTFKHHRDNFNYPQQQNDSNNGRSLKKSSGDSPTTMCGGHRAEDVIASTLLPPLYLHVQQQSSLMKGLTGGGSFCFIIKLFDTVGGSGLQRSP